MTEPRIEAPCGSWPSEVSATLVAGRTTGLSALRADGTALLWLESRPSEGGRVVLCRWQGTSPAQEITPAPFDVGSRVHEYGGGGYAASGGWIGFSHRPDGSVWLIVPGEAPRALCQVAGLRFADLGFTPDRRHLLAVREDHRDPGAAQPEAAIVALRLDAGLDASVNEGEVLVRGTDFLSSPRISPDGHTLAWIEWNHPDMPWDATRLHAAAIHADTEGNIALSEVRCLAGLARDEALLQPLFGPDGVLHVCSDRSGWWNLYRLSPEGGLTPVCPMQREVGVPPWVFGQRSYGFLPDGSVVAAATGQGRVQPLHIVGGTARTLPVGPVAECPVVLDGSRLGWLRASGTAPAAVMTASFRQDEVPDGQVLALAHALPLQPDDIAVAEAIGFPTADGGTGHAFYYPRPAAGTRCPRENCRPWW